MVLEELEFSGSLAAQRGPETQGSEGPAEGGVSNGTGAGAGREYTENGKYGALAWLTLES